MDLFLGIDGGGTKTDFALKNGRGEVFACSSCGTNNEVIGYERVLSILKTGIEELLGKSASRWKDISSACMGMAGIDLDIDCTNFEKEVLCRLPLECDVLLKNDAYVALKAGTDAVNGILLNAGSGIKTLGISENREIYSNAVGTSPLQDRVIAAMGREVELQMEDRDFSTEMGELLGVEDIHDYLQWLFLYNETRKEACPYSRSQMGGYPKAFFDLVRRGRKKAVSIFNGLLDDYCRLAVLMAEKLELQSKPFDLILSGSVFMKNRDLDLESVFFSAFGERDRRLVPARITVLDKPPYWGALMEAERMQRSS